MEENKRDIKIFEDYFSKNFWGNKTGTSGPNSDPALTPILRKNLIKMIQDLGIFSLLDAGCGDANLFKKIWEEVDPKNFNLKEYIGYECVPGLTALNQSFSGFNAKFKTADVIRDPLPKTDLILSRDVVHYLPNHLIFEFLENCRRSGSKFLLITHNLYSALSANSETNIGVFRPVNLTQKPFFWSPPLETIEEDVYGKALALFRLN
jgi:SAM-dependent methyltransferase